MSIISMLEKIKAKSLIRAHIKKSYKLLNNESQIIMNSSEMQRSLLVFECFSGPYVTLAHRVQITMVNVANAFMDELLNRADVELITDTDKSKVKYCMGVMTNLAGGEWFSEDCKLLRLDLWRRYWGYMDNAGVTFTRGEKNFVPAIIFMMVYNLEEGLLEMPKSFPITNIKNEVTAAY